MPNWVSIELSVSANSAEELEMFLDQVKDKEEKRFNLDFNSLIPQPGNLFKENLSFQKQKELDKAGIPNWYDWNNSNWNTKWNACHTDLDKESDTKCRIFFDTAWDFPYPVIDVMYDKYPNLEFEITATEESHAFAFQLNKFNERTDVDYVYKAQREDGEWVEVFWSNKEKCYVDDQGNQYDSYDNFDLIPVQ